MIWSDDSSIFFLWVLVQCLFYTVLRGDGSVVLQYVHSSHKSRDLTVILHKMWGTSTLQNQKHLILSYSLLYWDQAPLKIPLHGWEKTFFFRLLHCIIWSVSIRDLLIYPLQSPFSLLPLKYIKIHITEWSNVFQWHDMGPNRIVMLLTSELCVFSNCEEMSAEASFSLCPPMCQNITSLWWCSTVVSVLEDSAGWGPGPGTRA